MKLVTPGAAGYDDAPPRKALEALKTASILLRLRSADPPSRDKRLALHTFVEDASTATLPRDVAIKAWSAYRYGTAPPGDADLNRLVVAIEAALR